jgi:predicted acyltransferase
MSNSASPRYLALDVFRGLTLALMIIVNTPGGENSYASLEHAVWHGFTLTDLVFPSFLFVMGAAMSLSMKKFAVHNEAYFLKHVVKRGALIFLCGYLLYWFPFFTPDLTLAPFANTRVMGVLQRIGLCYLFASLIVRYSGLRGAAIFSAAALLGYWWILASFGDYTPGGNAVLKLDLALLGAPHMYHGEGIAFDPEGILSTLPAIVNVLAGYAAAVWLRHKGPSQRTLAALALAGAACLLLAYGWNALLPINKKLWTGSFVACTTGFDLIILALLVGVIDMAGLRFGTYFFEVLGKNTLFIYLLADVAVIVLARIHVDGQTLYRRLYEVLFLSWASPYNASLLFAVAYMLVCWLVAYAMDRKKIYIKL